jgi:hypothetical protein
MQDLVAGRIDYTCNIITSALPNVKGNQIKAMANLAPKRTPLLPELRTSQEQGLDSFDATTWNMVLLPKGTPAPIVQKLNAALSQALDTPTTKERLLNIGLEDMKGNETVREAGELLASSGVNYVGFVEGDGIFHADVDVVVSDGFVGNVALKTMEGVARLVGAFLKQEFRRSLLRNVQGLVAQPALEALRGRLDPRRYNGASLVGLNGIVLKSHGSADQFAFENAVKAAIVEARKGVPLQIGKLVENRPH